MKTQDLTLLGIKQVAEVLSIPYRTAQTMFHTKGFPHIRIGKRMYVALNSLQQWLSKAETAC